MNNKPFRVAVWGPGGIGQILIRECMKKPELELVGVLAYSPEKNGVDAGEYLGYGTAGVKMTIDKEDIFRLKPDCVLHCPQVTAGFDIDSEVTQDVCRMLESGINVISAVAYHYPALHGQEFVDKLENACLKGGTALHSTGINPGIINERWVVGLTGVCTSLKYIKVQEISNLTAIPSFNMLVDRIGIGKKVEQKAILSDLGMRYYSETVKLTCHLLGIDVDSVDDHREYIIADKRFEMDLVTVEPGTVGGVYMRFFGKKDGKTVFTLEEIFYVDESICPVDVNGAHYYITVEIEGEPTSLKAGIGLKASYEKDQSIGDDGAEPAYNATAVPMIQAIPLVCRAKTPGIIYPHTFAHYTPDLRNFKSPLIA